MFVSRLLIGVMGLLALAIPGLADERPNILLCVADDWGWPHAGAHGDKVVQTPEFDRLAREGVLSQHAFVSAPSCTPSRNAILTGQHFYRLDEGANLQSTLNVRHPNFMRLLEQAGYEIGHWRKAWGPGVFEPGGYESHPCGPDTTFETFVDKRQGDRPFCFWFGTSDPHRPYKTGSGAAGGVEAAKIRVPAFLPDHETVRSDIADYYFEVQRWDRDVAAAIALLEQAGELDNTIIVMTGDNGMPFPRCKANLYDWGSRAPLAVRWGAGVKAAGRSSDAFVSLVDLAPTFLAAAGVDVPAAMTGRSLLPLLTSDNVPADFDRVIIGRERHAAAQEIPSLEGYPARALRTERFLYIRNLDPNRWPVGVPENATHPIGQFPDCDNGPTKSFIIELRDDPQYRRFHELCFAQRPAEELYDVQTDPDQVRNLAADPAHGETLETLRARLESDLRRTGDPRFTGEPAKFDEYPYRVDLIHQRIHEWKQRQGAAAGSTQPRVP